MTPEKSSDRDEDIATGQKKDVLFCPSAQLGLSRSMILGIVDSGSDGDRVSYLKTPVAVTEGTIVAFTGSSVRPTSVLRFAAPCEKNGCHNWSGSGCRVAQRLVQILPAAANGLPDCNLRSRCRWHQQEGQSACWRCPQVVTDDAEFEATLNDNRLPEH